MKKFYNKFRPEVTAAEKEDGNYNSGYAINIDAVIGCLQGMGLSGMTQPYANHDKEIHEQSFETLLDAFWSDYRSFILEKDRKYGSRYLHPLAVFSDISPIDRLNARLDEKLGRLIAGNKDEDTFDDLLGLLIHRSILKRHEEDPRKN
jgi:hypothetical protein